MTLNTRAVAAFRGRGDGALGTVAGETNHARVVNRGQTKNMKLKLFTDLIRIMNRKALSNYD